MRRALLLDADLALDAGGGALACAAEGARAGAHSGFAIPDIGADAGFGHDFFHTAKPLLA